jgi:hypothetical protein
VVPSGPRGWWRCWLCFTDEDNRLIAPADHGLGVLCASFMALTGLTVWLGMSARGEMPGWTLFVLQLRQEAANLMWALMWANLLRPTAMAGPHRFLGHATPRRMLCRERGQE